MKTTDAALPEVAGGVVANDGPSSTATFSEDPKRSFPEVRAALGLVRSLIGEDLQAIEEILAIDLPSEFQLVPEVAHHLIGAGGKRIRPVLTCLAARACGAKDTSYRELAAIVEMVHTATLFHDDVIDEAKMRRGRKAAHLVYGAPIAILVGDRLYSDAFRRLLDLRPRRLAHDLAKAVRLVLEGEFFQLQKRGSFGLRFDQYLRLVGGKTAALFRFATMAAAKNAGSTRAIVQAAASYGWNLGIAFQMTDDVIDYESEGNATGKSRFSDLDDKKVSLPLLLAMRRDVELSEFVGRYMAKDGTEDGQMALRDEILQRIEQSGAPRGARALASRYAVRAKEALEPFADSSYASALRQITQYVCERNA